MTDLLKNEWRSCEGTCNGESAMCIWFSPGVDLWMSGKNCECRHLFYRTLLPPYPASRGFSSCRFYFLVISWLYLPQAAVFFPGEGRGAALKFLATSPLVFAVLACSSRCSCFLILAPRARPKLLRRLQRRLSRLRPQNFAFARIIPLATQL